MPKPKPEPGDPACVMCRAPVLPSDHVIAGHGELLHLRCCVGWSDVAQQLAVFLSERHASQFCHTCLGNALNVNYEETRKAVATLRTIRRVRVVVGPCSHCAASRVTVQSRSTRGSAEEPELRERIIERLEIGGLPRFLLTVDHEARTHSGSFTGPGTGKLCSACDAVLDDRNGRSLEFMVPPGHVLRFHRHCYEIWDQERHKARPR